MKRWKQVTSILLTLSMFFLTLPTTAFAETAETVTEIFSSNSVTNEDTSGSESQIQNDEGIDITILSVSIDGNLASATDGTLMYRKTVTVADKNGDGAYSLNEAMQCLHEQYCRLGAEGFGTTEDGKKATKVWGNEGAVVIFNPRVAASYNGYRGYAGALTSTNVTSGMQLSIGLSSAGTPGSTSVFPMYFYDASLTTYNIIDGYLTEVSSVVVDEETQTRLIHKNSLARPTLPSGATVKIYEVEDGVVAAEPAITTSSEANGLVTIKIQKPGYYLMTGAYSGCQDVAVCMLTVSAKEDKPEPADLVDLWIGLDENSDTNLLTPAFSYDNKEYTISVPKTQESLYAYMASSKTYDGNVVWRAKSETGTDQLGSATVCTLDSKEKGTIRNGSYSAFDVQFGNRELLNEVYETYHIKVKQIVTLDSILFDKPIKEPFSQDSSDCSVYVSGKDTQVQIKPTAENDEYVIIIQGEVVASGTAYNLDLTKLNFADGKAEVAIAVHREDSDGKYYADNTYTLTLYRLEEGEIPEILNQPESAQYIIGDEARVLFVDASADGELSYQWYKCDDSNGTNAIAISGATEKEYLPDISAAGTSYYQCAVTNTESELSENSAVACILVYPDPTPVVEWATEIPTLTGKGKQMLDEEIADFMKGYYQNNGYSGNFEDGFYYTVGETALPMIVTASSAVEDAELKYSWYCFYRGGAGGVGVASNSPIKVPPTDIAYGIRLYRCTVSCTVLDRKFTSSISTFVIVDNAAGDYTEIQDAWNGSGTETDPWKLSKQEDLEKIRLYVEQGYDFYDMYFVMTDDIALSNSWQSIGAGSVQDKGAEMKPFSGTLDGANHTLTYAENTDQPLFKYVREATVKNLKLYAPYLANYGLVSDYVVDYGYDGNYNVGYGGSYAQGCPDTIDIIGCTILGGSVIKYAGFIGGFASGGNVVNITNCLAEENVKIGWDKENNCPVNKLSIASFGGDMSGTISNCVSYADVYGKGYVGGIVASKGQSMGPFTVSNSAFYGTVTATERYAGGIVGGGYYSLGGAPNTPSVTIKNCYVAGTVTGEKNVGGIFGGEVQLKQCWENGIGYIQDNHFYGTVTATSGDGSVGGIIGLMTSLNKNTIIENNYFLDTCGAVSGIGKIELIDTSADHENTSGATYFNTAEALPGISGITQSDKNRTDDPAGKDADKLTKAMTAKQFADTTVVKLLNESGSSTKNWMQGEKYPVFGSEVFVLRLEASGEYKTEFTEGDELDLTGIELTAIWSDGSITNPTLDEVTIEGYDKETRGEQTVKITYGTVSTEIKVNVLKPAGENITVQISVFGDEVHTEDTTDVHTYADGNLTVWISETPCEVDINAKVVDVLNKILADNDMTCSNPSGNYVESITKDGVELGEFTNGQNSGWMYLLNGRYPDLGVDQQYLENGDILVFHYTDDYTREAWMENTDQKAADAVTELIEAIGEVSLESEAAIQEAREAYDALTEEQKALVPEETLAKLISAEEKLEELKNQTPEPPAAKDVSDIFKDVRKDTWYHDYVQYVYDHGIMTGMKEDVFAPASILGRAQFATVIWRMEGSPKVSYEKKFKDVPNGAWYTDAVMWASEAGIITGYTAGAKAGCFGPADSATREQLALMMYRYANYKGYDTQKRGSLGSFSDAGRVSSFAKEAMEWAVGYGIISGKDNETRLDPQGKTSRAETAAIITRFRITSGNPR